MPSLLAFLIFDIDTVIERNISGTTTTKSILINISPKGLRILAFSLNISPIIVPIITAKINIILDL